MKTNKLNALQSIAIIALVAMIGFAFITCDKDKGSSNVTVNIRSSNNGGTKPSGARSVVSRAVEITPFASTIFDSFYSGLGSQVGSNITPTELKVGMWVQVLLSDGMGYQLDEGIFDFVSGVTVNVGDVPTDITVVAVALYLVPTGVQFSNGTGGWCTVKFPVPSEYDSTVFSSSRYNFTYPAFSNQSAYTPSVANNTASFVLQDLLPERIGTEKSIRTILFYNGFDTKDIIEDTFTIGGHEVGQTIMGEAPSKLLKVPFNSVTIPEGTSSVTFGISWNVNGIIQQYQGADNTSNTADDVFIFKNGWWNDVYLTATVQ